MFREEVFASLSSIKDKFHFTFINADASPEVVQKVSGLCVRRLVVHDARDCRPCSHVSRPACSQRILHEFSYQSSLDLHESSYEVVCKCVRQGAGGGEVGLGTPLPVLLPCRVPAASDIIRMGRRLGRALKPLPTHY